MPKFSDLSGMNIGRWKVLRRVDDHISKSGYHFTQYECQCRCGTVKNVLASALKSGRSQSCGCYNAENKTVVCGNNFRTHGETKTRLYQIYAGIKKRCYNENAQNYKNYGGRGITVCDEWESSWYAFRDWALLNGYTDALTIDRIDVNGNYEPNNCRWVDKSVQANNRRTNRIITYAGESHTIAEWSKILDVPYKRLFKWIANGKQISDILTN